MFRYQINALHDAERRIRIGHTPHGYIVTMDERQLTEPTSDKIQVTAWHKHIVINAALHKLGLPVSKTAGLLAQSIYNAFAYEVEK